jgi:hypothetical protein
MEDDAGEEKTAQPNQEPADPTSAAAWLDSGFSIFAHGFG